MRATDLYYEANDATSDGPRRPLHIALVLDPGVYGRRMESALCRHPGCISRRVIRRKRRWVFGVRQSVPQDENQMLRAKGEKYCEFHARRENRETPGQRRQRLLAQANGGGNGHHR